MATSRRRYLAVSLAGLVVTCAGDWVGYLLVAPTMGWAFLRGFALPPRLTPRFAREPYARWWAISVLVMVGFLAWWIGLFAAVDQILQWLERGGGPRRRQARDAPRGAPGLRAGWIDFSFTPLAIALEARSRAPLCLLRWLVLRRDEETYAPSFLFGAVVQYVAFRKGADVHIYWSHYFAAYFALALATLAGSVGLAVDWLARRWRRDRAPLAGTVALVVGLLPVAAMAHDAVASLAVWRRTGGRYDEHGATIRSHVDLLAVIRQVILPRVRPGLPMDVHRSTMWGWEFLWTYQGVGNVVDAPKVGAADAGAHPFWLSPASGLNGEEQRKIAAQAHVEVYGDAWVVDQRTPAAPLDAYALEEREPGPLEWFVHGGTEPVRTAGRAPDPWLTWEWRTHLGQAAAVPAGEPRSIDEMRIAHNVAVESGRADEARRWRSAIDAQLDRAAAASFTQGIDLVTASGGSTAWSPGSRPGFQHSGDVPAGDASFDVRSTVGSARPAQPDPPGPDGPGHGGLHGPSRRSCGARACSIAPRSS